LRVEKSHEVWAKASRLYAELAKLEASVYADTRESGTTHE
jgi:hypothetical protein